MALKGIKRINRPISKDDPIRQPRPCKVCGDVFTPPHPTRLRKGFYCSGPCRQKGISLATAEKRGNILRGRGDAKTYTKRSGRHEHRIIVETIIGRSLRSDEIVHHINHDRKDNRPENLQVMNKADHTRHHSKHYWSNREAINA